MLCDCWNHQRCYWPRLGAALRSGPVYADAHVGDGLVDWKTLRADDAVAVVVVVALKGPKGTDPGLPPPPPDLWPW